MKRYSEPEPQPERENVSGGTPDPMADYKSALADLSAAQEKLGTLQSVRADLEGQLARAEVDDEAALQRASEADDLGAAEADERLRIADRLKVLQRKLVDVAHRLEVAEREWHGVVTQAAMRFSTLWRTFLWWVTEKEVAHLKAGLAAPCDGNLLQVVAGCSHAVVATRKMEITGAENAEVLHAAAQRLLEAVSSADSFVVPAYAPTPIVPSEPQEEPIGVPWGDRGVNVDEELRQMYSADPGLTMPEAMRRLKERFPQIFKAPEGGVLTLNEPLPKMRDMVGSTYVPEEPAEEQFSHAR